MSKERFEEYLLATKMSNISSSTTGADDRQGWTPSPDGRGTMSIIWSCAITTFLCCWSVLVINLPGPESTHRSTFSRKLFLLGLCAAAPEAIFQVALGQWLSAKDSQRLFHGSGYSDWTLRHSFFVDMGGLHLRCPGHSSFPINSRQLHFLITNGYVTYPSIEENQIRDRNKVDGTLRLLTLIQTLFFQTNMLLRAVQKLAVTALELSTSAFVVLSISTTVFWFRKPADVERCEFIEANVPIATILANHNLPVDAAYNYTPLDFIGREEWSWSILWMHGLNCLRKLHLAGQPQQLPVQRFQNTIVPVIHGWFLALFAVLSLVYLGLFVAGWNYSFPTSNEQILWRSASLTALITAVGVFLTQQIFFNWCSPLRRNSNRVLFSSETSNDLMAKQNKYVQKMFGKLNSLKNKFDDLAATLRNNSVVKDPALDAPVGAVLLTWFFGFLYVSARAYIIVADFVELRSLPRNAYKTLNLSSLTPYIP